MTHSLVLHHRDAPGHAQQINDPWRFQRFNTTDFADDMILSPSPPPQPGPVQLTDPQPAMQVQADTTPPPPDPQIASLKAIFSDFDDAVIASVLESTDHDHDRALDVLLGMNDPSFVPPNPPPAVQSPHGFRSPPGRMPADVQRLSQEALDEQFARRLALEEQQQAASQAWQQPRGPGVGMEGRGTYQPYQPRRGGRSDWGGQPPIQGQPQPQSQGGRDTMAEFQEGFSRIAESGKKTFTSLVSKMRAKMQEFDQGQGWSWSQSQSSQAGPASSYAPGPQQGPGQGAYAPPHQSVQSAYPQRQASQPRPSRTNTYASSPPRSGISRPTITDPAPSASPQEPSYYDPNTRGYDLYDDDEDGIQLDDRTTATAAAAAVPATTQGSATPPRVDNPGPASTPPQSDTTSLPSYSSAQLANQGAASTTNSPARPLSPAIIAGTRGATPGAPGVDFSKLGLLPKRPISLVRPQSPPAAGASVAVAHSESTADGGSSTDHEEPEFVENPFEDPR